MKKKEAIYAGSFDPWTFGHWYVLQSAIQIFDKVHILVSVNPSKPGLFSVDEKIELIRFFLDPIRQLELQETRKKDPKAKIRKIPDTQTGNQSVVLDQNCLVHSTEHLVVDFAFQKEVYHLIRGLRSTSDFEAEFNLYFSNLALQPKIQTWTIMCPPRLLHCSSTFVKTVAKSKFPKQVGASFAIQSRIKAIPLSYGLLFDCICYSYFNQMWPTIPDSEDFLVVMQKVFNGISAKIQDRTNKKLFQDKIPLIPSYFLDSLNQSPWESLAIIFNSLAFSKAKWDHTLLRDEFGLHAADLEILKTAYRSNS